MAKTHFETQREYLVEKGLAKAGRGKFSKVAHEALAEATAKGITFGPVAKPATSEDSDSLGKSEASVGSPAEASPSVIRQWAIAQGMDVPKRGRLSADIIAAYTGNPLTPKPVQSGLLANPVPRQERLRLASTLYGLTEEGFKVGYNHCRRCKASMVYCDCRDGVLPPSIVVKVLDTVPA